MKDEPTAGSFHILAYSDENDDTYIRLSFAYDKRVTLIFPLDSAKEVCAALTKAIEASEAGVILEQPI